MKKTIVVVLFISLFLLIYQFKLHHYASLDIIKENLTLIQDLESKSPVFFSFGFFVLYILIVISSLPAAAPLLTLTAGAIFGFSKGVIFVSFASTIGASCAFLVARYLLRDFFQERFQKSMATINRGLEKDGSFYLFILRLTPLFPFILINIIMGLTKFSLGRFYIISQLGMLPGTMAYVNAGLQLSKLNSLKDILSFNMLISFALLGIIPLISKKIIDLLKRKKIYTPYKNMKPKKFDYDMVAIGGGSAGLVTAYISSAVKAKVALIERDKMGGDCLNTGCVPSKALIRTAHLLHDAKNSKKFGIKKIAIDLEFSDIMNRVHKIIQKIEPHDSVERYSELGVTCLKGKAQITSPWTIEINGKTISTRNICIASGASPFIPRVPGLSKIDYLTSDSLWNLKELPKKLLILGAGPIACELAQAFSRIGSHVTILGRNKRLMTSEDPDVSELIEKIFSKEGIEILSEHNTISFEKEDKKKVLHCEHNGKNKKIYFDKLLIATGRKARTKGFGLEELGLNIRENGTIEVNDYLQTKYPNIFACGDVTGPYQFTHTAAYQAWFCSVNGLFGTFKKFKIDYSIIPWCTYTDPEIATVGLTEQRAKEQEIPYELTKYELNDLDRAITDEADYGFVKVLTVPGKDKILGATIAGANASNLLLEFVSAMKHGFGLNKILASIHVYPSMGEANKYAAGVWKKAHAPQKILKYLEKYFTWKRS